MKHKSECVKVAIRVRPMNNNEKKSNSVNCVEVDKNNNQISVIKSETNETKTFQFDYVYAPNTPQRNIYDDIAFPLIESVFEGYNGTIFAYGQTGCGKTFTMMGDHSNHELRGIIPNAFAHIFAMINNENSNKKFLIRCSFIEIYNEEIRDLLGKDSSKKLDIREDQKLGIYVKDLNIIQVANSNEIENALNTGNKNRHVGETSMNQESSRSHCIFSVYVEIAENIDSNNKKIRAGKLNLVDLAGSERQSKTGATGVRFDEAKKINLSLTALSNVINALSDKKGHTPYRDSKLTRLLQDSLGGNTKTVMIAAISPSSFNYEETLGTLRYAARANSIANVPKVNEDPKDALLRQYEEQIMLLKDQIQNGDVQPLPANMDNFLREKDQMLFSANMEKEKLMQRIIELEKEMNIKMLHGGEERDENFKQYREKQNKAKEEYNKKKNLLDAINREEENNLFNEKQYANMQIELEEKNKIIAKLRNKSKYLDTEIRDLRYENERDREDFTNAIREIYKENKLYQGMMRVLLNEGEIKRIIELSKWNEESEEWKIQAFSFKDKSLKLPNLKHHQEHEQNNRDLVIDEPEHPKFYKESRTKLRYDEPPDYLTHPFNKPKEPANKRVVNLINQNNMIMNKKELKKFEDMAKSVNLAEHQNFNTFNQANSSVNNINNYQRKASKIILNPIGIGQGKSKKMEVSFKATLEFRDMSSQKIQIKPNFNSEWQGMDKIVENGGNEYEEY